MDSLSSIVLLTSTILGHDFCIVEWLFTSWYLNCPMSHRRLWLAWMRTLGSPVMKIKRAAAVTSVAFVWRS